MAVKIYLDGTMVAFTATDNTPIISEPRGSIRCVPMQGGKFSFEEINSGRVVYEPVLYSDIKDASGASYGGSQAAVFTALNAFLGFSSGGGGGSADKNLAPKIVVGNSANGDTLADCDYLDLGDGAQLQVALQAADALGGAMVFLRDGTYLVSSNLSMTGSGITLTGSKNAIIASNVSRTLLLINAANSTVDGIGFSSLADSSGVAVITIEQPQVSIKNCTFDIVANTLLPETIAVLNFESAANNFSIVNNEFNISNFDDTTMECYPAYVLECQYGKFTGNQITGGSGVFLQTCQYMDIDFVGQNLRAVNVQDSANINIKVIGDVTIPNVGAGAAYESAIYIENSSKVLVLGANLVDASLLGKGVNLVNSPNCTILGCAFQNFSIAVDGDVPSTVGLINANNQVI